VGTLVPHAHFSTQSKPFMLAPNAVVTTLCA
jgi:hypothetical protein